MLKFVSKALLSVFMDKTARDKLEAVRAAKARAQADTDGAKEAGEALPLASESTPSRREALAPGLAVAAKKGPRPMTPERQALIREALAVQRSQSHLFDELSDDAKAKLLIAAVKAFHIPPDDIEKSLRAEPARKPVKTSMLPTIPPNGRRDKH